jgi:hypothetical protein
MDNKNFLQGNFFTLCLRSLQAQASSIMDEVGGKDAIELLDKLSGLDPHMRSLFIRSVIQTLDTLSTGNDTYSSSVKSTTNRKNPQDDIASEMSNDILEEFALSSNVYPIPASIHKTATGKKISILNGGKETSQTNNSKNARVTPFRKIL